MSSPYDIIPELTDDTIGHVAGSVDHDRRCEEGTWLLKVRWNNRIMAMFLISLQKHKSALAAERAKVAGLVAAGDALATRLTGIGQLDHLGHGPGWKEIAAWHAAKASAGGEASK